MSSNRNSIAHSAKSIKVGSKKDIDEEDSYEDSKMYNKEQTFCGNNKKVMQWFVKFTSIGGFTHSRDSDNQTSRFIWGILFLAGVVLTLLGIIQLVRDFCRYEAITNVELGHNSSGLIFPAVTVCNQNRIHCGHLYDKIISCNHVSTPQADIRKNSG